MATSPLGGFANIAPYQAAAIQQSSSNPLDSLIQGFQTGNQIQQLPKQLQDQELTRQVNNAILRQKLFDLQNPQLALARQVQEKAAVDALNPESGVYQAPANQIGLTIGNPRAITPEQQSTLGSPIPSVPLEKGFVQPYAPPMATETPIAPGGYQTGYTENPNTVYQAEQNKLIRAIQLGQLTEKLQMTPSGLAFNPRTGTAQDVPVITPNQSPPLPAPTANPTPTPAPSSPEAPPNYDQSGNLIPSDTAATPSIIPAKNLTVHDQKIADKTAEDLAKGNIALGNAQKLQQSGQAGNLANQKTMAQANQENKLAAQEAAENTPQTITKNLDALNEVKDYAEANIRYNAIKNDEANLLKSQSELSKNPNDKSLQDQVASDNRTLDTALNENFQRLLSNQRITSQFGGLLYQGQPLLDKINGFVNQFTNGGNAYTDETRLSAVKTAEAQFNAYKQARDAQIEGQRATYPDKNKFDKQIAPHFPGYVPGSIAPSTQTLPTVKTQADFDALPHNSDYIGTNGQPHHKP